jgi:ribosomal protein S18 acetylase RimI-like enzyme
VDPATSLADALDTPRGSVFVGALDGEIVAYGVLALETLTDGGVLGRIEDLFVAPQARGIGLGEALMAAIVESAEEAGCFGLDALVLPGNRATKNFFEASGLTARAIVVHRSLG